ncbi:MAG: hypothetical protein M1828_002009 [Chrysothrix sp. TS-e1954]|nr:MAG: hypothetical protein M1828_002009 [Chrysothrix sp. TS-e1954]
MSTRPSLTLAVPEPRSAPSEYTRWAKDGLPSGWCNSADRDLELWDSAGDIVVFLDDGHQCSPLARLASEHLKGKRCGSLLALAYQGAASLEITLKSTAHTESPLSTRNLIAWVCDKPLLGQCLGRSLEALLDQMRTYRDSDADNVEDFLAYADLMGYSFIANCPDHALSMLALAEYMKHRLVWVDSFAHCVGMSDRLLESTQYEVISKSTRALIVQASMEMESRIDHASAALGTFLEEDISSTHLGLGEGVRTYLEAFRSVLHSYHVARHGYWPPVGSATQVRKIYASMYHDFSELYELLVDRESSMTTQSWKSMNGGICVVQHIENFNARHSYEALPCSSPLLPQSPVSSNRNASQKSLRNLWSASKELKAVRVDRLRGRLFKALNQDDRAVLANALVQHYLAFEAEAAAEYEDKLSPAETRKICWILIYATLQTLASIVHTPPEVRTASAVEYPLCISTGYGVPWDDQAPAPGSPQTTEFISAAEQGHDRNDEVHTASKVAFTIEPDCERDDYFVNKPTSHIPLVEPDCMRDDYAEVASKASHSTAGYYSSSSESGQSQRLARKGTLRGILRTPSTAVRRSGTQSSRVSGASPARRRRITWSDASKRGSPLAEVDPLGGFDHVPEPQSASDSSVAEASWPLLDTNLAAAHVSKSWPLSNHVQDEQKPTQDSRTDEPSIQDPRPAPTYPLTMDDALLARSDSDSAPSLTWSYRSHDTSDFSERDDSATNSADPTKLCRNSSLNWSLPSSAKIDGHETSQRQILREPEHQSTSHHRSRSSTSSGSFTWHLPSHDAQKELKVMPGRYRPAGAHSDSTVTFQEPESGRPRTATRFSIDVANLSGKAHETSYDSGASSSTVSEQITPIEARDPIDRCVAVSLDGQLDDSTLSMYRSLSVR